MQTEPMVWNQLVWAPHNPCALPTDLIPTPPFGPLHIPDIMYHISIISQ